MSSSEAPRCWSSGTSPSRTPDRAKSAYESRRWASTRWTRPSQPCRSSRHASTSPSPSGFGYDFAGSVDEVGRDASGFTVGDRVYGGVMERAAADFVVMRPDASEPLFHTPEGLSEEVASTLYIAGATASAALAPLELSSTDTVLVGGAAGGVGRVRGSAGSPRWRNGDRDSVGGHIPVPERFGGTTGRLRRRPWRDRVRVCAPQGITAAIDLFGTETIETALALGVSPDRITAIAAGPTPPGGALAIFGTSAPPNAVPEIASAIVAHELTVPIAATFPIEQIGEAAALQAGRHVHGKIVVTL